MKGARSLAVETEVLGEGLCDAELEALLDKVVDWPGVIVQVAGSEALVSAVEEGEVRLLAHYGGDLFPLVLSGVDARGVMSAGMEEDDAAFRCFF